VLTQLRRQGLLPVDVDIALLETVPNSASHWGPRLDALIARGIITEAAVATVMAQVTPALQQKWSIAADTPDIIDSDYTLAAPPTNVTNANNTNNANNANNDQVDPDATRRVVISQVGVPPIAATISADTTNNRKADSVNSADVTVKVNSANCLTDSVTPSSAAIEPSSCVISDSATNPVTNSVADSVLTSGETQIMAEVTPLPANSDETVKVARPQKVTGKMTAELANAFNGAPIKYWEHYDLLEKLGEGGMGVVFKGRDRRLQRYVALKFIRGSDKDTVERFLCEAQAQAKVQHEHVCRIYEVGEVQGHYYIAMQYIEGISLKDAQEKLTLEEKVRITRQVAEAIQAMHSLGLIHRDIKPANIMLEAKDGGWHPYLMDFGLARQTAAQGQTAAGTIMGTPAYMAPEQINGDTRLLDRRADVYSLGATLYELVTGKVPFWDTNPYALIFKVTKEEPPLPISIKPNLPLDLQSITLKCLEKEPQRRYDSAKALARDLQRYLDGEPITIRPTTWRYRVWRLIKKHKALTAVSLVALLAILVAGAIAVQSQWTIAEQTRQAQEFGQEVEDITAAIRYSQMLPRHDVTAEKAAIRRRTQMLETRLKSFAKANFGTASYALGYVYYTFKELDRARFYLEAAWQSGYRTAEVSFQLGLVMGDSYHRELERARLVSDPESRKTLISTIEKTYREATIRYLRASRAINPEDTLFIDGLLDFYEFRYQTALKKFDMVLSENALFEAAIRQKGLTYIEMAEEARKQGDFSLAKQYIEQAVIQYRAVTDISRSDVQSYLLEAECWLRAASYNRDQSLPLETAQQEGLAALDKALEIDYLNPDAYVSQLNFYELQTLEDVAAGHALQGIAQAREIVAKVEKLGIANSRVYSKLGYMFMLQGQDDLNYGRDPQPIWQEAIETFKKAQQLEHKYDPTNAQRDPTTPLGLGGTYWRLARYQLEHGRDPRAILRQTADLYQQALQVVGDNPRIYNSLGNVHTVIGMYEIEHGLAPDASFAQATNIYRKALQVDPKIANAYHNLGLIGKFKSQQLLYLGQDPRVSVQACATGFRQGIAISPSAEAYRWMGEGYLKQAEYEVRQGIDPQATFDLAGEALANSLSANATNFETYVHRAKLAILQAEWQQKVDNLPQRFWRLAQEDLDYARRLNGTSGLMWQVYAQLYLQQATLLTGNAQRQAGQKGLAACQAALTINPEFAPVLLLAAELRLIALQSVVDAQLRTTEIAAIRELIDKAVAINPFLQHTGEKIRRQLTD
jgi:serine/threonine-protein kinase